MTDAITARTELDGLARQLGDLATKLAECCRTLEPVETEYRAFIDDYETGLWLSHVDDGAKFPPATVRVQLAHRAMAPELLGRYRGLTNSRDRLQERIRSLKSEIEARRSILSALKVEQEATA